MFNLDKLAVYVDNNAGKEQVDVPTNMCGFVSRLNNALFKPKLHIQCMRPMTGRYPPKPPNPQNPKTPI